MIPFPIAILAGGMATRMWPATEKIPKSLLEVAGEPFLAHQLRLLAEHGVQRVVLCLGHLGEQVRDFAGDGSRFGLRVDYSFDGPKLRGTGGALQQALPLLGDRFLVMYGDSYLPCNYRAIAEAFAASSALGFMVVYRNRGQFDASNVEYAAGRILRYSKTQRDERMEHIDYGLGGLDRRAFDLVPAEGVFDLATLYGLLLERGQLAGYDELDRFYEIGSTSGLQETHQLLLRKKSMGFTEEYLRETSRVVAGLDALAIDRCATLLAEVRQRGGRLFILGVGGSAANASHAVNDFRKIVGLEAYAPTDNVSELTARTNDEGWATIFAEWLRGSRLTPRDALLVFSVGGGSEEKNVSPNLVAAIRYAKEVGAAVLGIVGRDGGFTAKNADACVLIPVVNPAHVTPHSEAFQAVVWHLFVSHPLLKNQPTKWESIR